MCDRLARSPPRADYSDLGADFYLRRDNPEVRKDRLVRQLQELGYSVELTLAA
jgi:transposase